MQVLKLMDVFLVNPWLGLLVSGAFWLLWSRMRGKWIAFAALSWLLYAIYECLMSADAFRCGDYNIRIDLLAIYPVLLLLSFVAVVQALRLRIGKSARAA